MDIARIHGSSQFFFTLNKSADECGLAAEVFRYIPTSLTAKILYLYNDVLSNGPYPFKLEADFVTDFRPVAFYTIVLQNVCLHDTAQNTGMS